MERILNMILRRVVSKGVNSGIRAMSKRGEGDGKTSQQDREMAQQARQSGKNLRQVSKVMRRLNKF